MTDKRDGMNYVPQVKQSKVCAQGEFTFAAIGLAHGHILGMCEGMINAGAELKWVYDDDQKLVATFSEKFPQVKVASSEAQVLEDSDVKLVAAAAVPAHRCDLGCRVMDHGKDYFTDKCPMTTLDQLAQARAKTEATGRKYMVYYGERLMNESAIYAGQLIADGAIGRGTGPHRLNAANRPEWFFQRQLYGGILCDIGSHQAEQFLHFADAEDARVLASKVGNYNNKQYPELEDFGDATLLADNEATCYMRVDWLTPDGLPTWGDGRTIVLGTDGYIEMRRYIDLARDPTGSHLYLVNQQEVQHLCLEGKVGISFFGDLIGDCLNRTENAMTQRRAFKAAEIALLAQAQAIRVK